MRINREAPARSGLASLASTAGSGLQRFQASGRALRVGAAERNPVLAGRFGLVECGVRPAVNRLPVRIVGQAQGEAEAPREAQQPFRRRERLLAEWLRMRSATSCSVCSLMSPKQSTANSSPPKRAAMSEELRS